MRELFVDKKVRLAMISLAVVLIFGIAWMVEHGGRPIWTRDSGSLRVSAYLHGSPGDYHISSESKGSVGTIKYLRCVQSLDDNLIATEALDCRKLTARFNDSWQPIAPSAFLRWRAFLHFGQPAILLGDTDGVRTLWFGYPGELLMLAAFILGFGACVLLVIRMTQWAANEVGRATDPYFTRLRALRRGQCPCCRYQIRDLPLPRCPECGEEWSEYELRFARSHGFSQEMP